MHPRMPTASAALALASAIGAFVTGSLVLAMVAVVILVSHWRARGLVAALVACVAVGCAPAVTTQPVLHGIGLQSLGFQGRLAGDVRGGLPASVAAALDPGADVVFTYDERIEQSHEELPAVVLIFASTLHLLGLPTGWDEVKARADLTITHRAREIGRYRGEAAASQTYGLYYGADMLELEEQARAAVRRVVDEAVSADVTQLRARLDSPQH